MPYTVYIVYIPYTIIHIPYTVFIVVLHSRKMLAIEEKPAWHPEPYNLLSYIHRTTEPYSTYESWMTLFKKSIHTKFTTFIDLTLPKTNIDDKNIDTDFH